MLTADYTVAVVTFYVFIYMMCIYYSLVLFMFTRRLVVKESVSYYHYIPLFAAYTHRALSLRPSHTTKVVYILFTWDAVLLGCVLGVWDGLRYR